MRNLHENIYQTDLMVMNHKGQSLVNYKRLIYVNIFTLRETFKMAEE